MNEREVSVDAAREERRVLVVWLHHDAQTLEGAKILGQRERHAGTASTECRVGNRVFAELLDPSDARILDPPKLLAMVDDIGRQGGSLVDEPTIDAIFGSSRAKM